ncbi:ATP-binding cassette domain-containing protein [Microlunatus sp. Gsoil 973]|jgi:ABC-type multidrug transport system ATPase subunit|uniref:ATP-binding cassette domain-containing protein n=1 Tax=Microlunatus sp. Gsoil 973 TaxID=2672569 RepID=UPI0012B4A519|nr:ATP-binding cassette domain-containing protein [Microlunatus sp. Gsoil 973]QGN34130.1 ATP-binding cassette domain-containing protein [Microlunatus sp. Gsoil 973]
MTQPTPQRAAELDDDDVINKGDPQERPAPLITAEGLDFGTGALRVFGGLDFEIPAGRLAVIIGPAGTGKSILLAAMVGRFAGFRGRLQVAGLDAHSASRQLRMISTAARIGSYVDLEPKHTIADAVTERAAIEGLRGHQAEARFERFAHLVDLDLDPEDLIDDLDGYHRTMLTVGLAMLRPSRVLVLDDAHRDLNTADQRRLLGGLVDLAASTTTTIVTSSVESTTIPYDAVRITLPSPGTSVRTTPSR